LVPASEVEPGAMTISGIVLYVRRSGEDIFLYCPDATFVMKATKNIQVFGRVSPGILSGVREAAHESVPDPSLEVVSK